MLHKETVERKTFGLLRTLMKDGRLSDFTLVGGTALALYLGHRKSIDLDLFTKIPYDEKPIESYLSEKYGFDVDVSFKNSLIGYINGIKVDLITLKYPHVEDPIESEDGIRICSITDIAAMKLSAMADAGTRLKDFIDVAFLSTRLSFSDMLTAYEKKYNNPEKLRPIRGLTFFEEIDFTIPVEMMHGYFKKSDWGKIEERLNDMIKKENKVFRSPPLQ
ncbi:MAG: nucleotidyl transferase AbiEii/AbiGii toxin family protein [Bacteroidales bacterium]|nr:nucleotidyl transferase AbiEii/AbiGii toxin family protein [Bacteroidales bacterium]